jgi:hypothetical protein
VKNLSQFRKALTIGSEWTCESFSDNPAYRRGPNPRTVVHVQSNAVAFSKPGVPYDGDPHKSGSWLYFDGANGKAANWSFPDNNTAIFTYPPIDGKPRADNPKLIYRRATPRQDKPGNAVTMPSASSA